MKAVKLVAIENLVGMLWDGVQNRAKKNSYCQLQKKTLPNSESQIYRLTSAGLRYILIFDFDLLIFFQIIVLRCRFV